MANKGIHLKRYKDEIERVIDSLECIANWDPQNREDLLFKNCKRLQAIIDDLPDLIPGTQPPNEEDITWGMAIAKQRELEKKYKSWIGKELIWTSRETGEKVQFVADSYTPDEQHPHHTPRFWTKEAKGYLAANCRPAEDGS